MKTAYDIVIRPLITEQSMEDLDIKKYAFEVAKDANKIEIAKAVEEIFGVTVIKVTTLNVRGKAKRTGAYPMGKTASWKRPSSSSVPTPRTLSCSKAWFKEE